MRKKSLAVWGIVLLLLGISLQVEAAAPGPTPPPPANSCDKQRVCFHSSEYWLFRVDNLPRGVVWVGGSLGMGISTESRDRMWMALRGNQMGGSTPFQKLNQEFLAFQLSIIFNKGGQGSPAYLESLLGPLACYGFTNTVALSNGASLSPQSTIGDLMDQARLAFHDYRSADFLPLWSFFIRLNTDDPMGIPCQDKVDPGMYCCQEVVQGADGLVTGSDCVPIKLAEKDRCGGYNFSCSGETLGPAGLSKCKLVP